MERLISDLKATARHLHHAASAGDPAAIGRIRKLAEFRKADDPAIVEALRRRHALAVIAHELGFAGWPHAIQVLAGDGDDTTDFGTLLYPSKCAAHTNVWCATYREASDLRPARDSYLLAYKRQFFLVDRHFIDDLGLDPDAPEWQAMGRDWVKPPDREARARLYEKLIRQRLAA